MRRFVATGRQEETEPTGGDGATLQRTARWQPVSLPLRAYLYALQGYFIEVNFIAFSDLIEGKASPKLFGYASMWSLFVYSAASLVMERINAFLQPRGVPLLVRAAAQALWMYAWEFTTGCVLSLFDACWWDYSNYRYNLAGLITLEYAPLWFSLGVIFEVVFAPNIGRIAWVQHAEMSPKIVS
ncbi:transmembrane protein 229b-like [Haemaphysalis longicornis]